MSKRDQLLSIKESAEWTGLKPVTLRMWAARRKLTVVKLGRRVLIPAGEIERLIQESTIPALPDRTR